MKDFLLFVNTSLKIPNITTYPRDLKVSHLFKVEQIRRCTTYNCIHTNQYLLTGAAYKEGKRKVQGVLQSQAAAHHKHEEEEETDKTKQAQNEQDLKQISSYNKPTKQQRVRLRGEGKGGGGGGRWRERMLKHFYGQPTSHWVTMLHVLLIQ